MSWASLSGFISPFLALSLQTTYTTCSGLVSDGLGALKLGMVGAWAALPSKASGKCVGGSWETGVDTGVTSLRLSLCLFTGESSSLFSVRGSGLEF